MPTDNIAAQALYQLAANVNRSPLDVLDWERFYIFVVSAAH